MQKNYQWLPLGGSWVGLGIFFHCIYFVQLDFLNHLCVLLFLTSMLGLPLWLSW